MTFIVETGANVANSNSYVSVAEADSYHDLMGNTSWAGRPTNVKQLALMKATQSIDLLYGSMFKVAPAYNSQSLQFPRQSFTKNKYQQVVSGTIPNELKTAVYEVAFMSLNGVDIYPSTSSESNLKSRTDQLGELTESVEYFKANNPEMYEGFGKIEKILKPILLDTKKHSTGYYSL